MAVNVTVRIILARCIIPPENCIKGDISKLTLIIPAFISDTCNGTRSVK